MPASNSRTTCSTWLREHGYEPVDHGPFVYDALDDYPVFCLRAAEGVAAERASGRDSLGVVIGGSGNGEQMAANKVTGVRSALAWSEETARLAREHNDANVVSVGGRMHTLDDMTRFVEVFLATPFSGDERHVRRIGQAGRLRGDRRAAAAAGVRPRAREPAMPEGHTLHRLAAELTERSRAEGAGAEPAGPVRRRARRCSTATLLVGAEAWGKHLFVEFTGERFVHVHLGLIGKFDVRPRPRPSCRSRSARCGCGWSRTAPRDVVRRSARGDRVRAGRPAASDDAVVGRLGPRPAPADADPDARLGPDPAQQAPIGALLMDQSVLAGRRQRLPRRGAVPAPDRTRCGRATRCARAVAGDVGRPRRADGGGRAHRPDRHRPARAHARGDGPPAARGRPRRRGLRLPPYGPAVPGLRDAGPHRRAAGRNLFWCPRCQPRFRSRAVQ